MKPTKFGLVINLKTANDARGTCAAGAGLLERAQLRHGPGG